MHRDQFYASVVHRPEEQSDAETPDNLRYGVICEEVSINHTSSVCSDCRAQLHLPSQRVL